MAAKNIGSTGQFQVTAMTQTTPFSHQRGMTPDFFCTPTMYKMRGYNVSAGSYETWVTSSPIQPPPSGHTLSDVAVVDIIPAT